MLFGAHRRYHAKAREVCQQLDIPVTIFEEGYLRPDWITADENGILSESSTPRDPAFYAQYEPSSSPLPVPRVGSFILHGALWHFTYALGGVLLRRRFPHYVHHKPYSWAFGFSWVGKGLLNLWRKSRDLATQRRIIERHSKRYWFVPLQVRNDSAITHHSRYTQITDFIVEVIGSFAKHAPPDHQIILKHHPLDPGLKDYRDLIADLARHHQVSDRVTYVHQSHLPSLLDHACGTITINSSVGLSSLFHGTPVMAMGSAVYDIPGLTHQGSLDAFWQNPGTVSRPLFESLVSYLRDHSQQVGSFYRRLPASRLRCGIITAPRGQFAGLFNHINTTDSATSAQPSSRFTGEPQKSPESAR